VNIWFATGALSATCGPLLGGALITASWRWLFLINLPVSLLAFLGAARGFRTPSTSRALGFPTRSGVHC